MTTLILNNFNNFLTPLFILFKYSYNNNNFVNNGKFVQEC